MTNDDRFDASPGRAPSTPTRRPGPVVALSVAAAAVPIVIVAVVLCALLPALPWWLGVIVGLMAAAVLVAVRLRGAFASVLRQLSAVPADPDRHPRFHNIAQGLSLAGGVGEPELYVVEDPGRNAAALAHGGRSAIVASTGLLGALDRIELEGIVAECLVRIRNGDAEASTVGAALFGPLLGGPARALGRRGLRSLLAEDRDLLADRAAVALTRYPPGLSAAFNTIGAASPRLDSVGGRLDHVWLVPPASLDASAATATDTPPLTLRIDVLGEL